MKFYIVNYTSYATGGAELLQQYCHSLRAYGYDAVMLLGNENEVALCEGAYAQYQNPYCFECPDVEESVLVTYEAFVHLLRKYKKARKAIWWLSASNYYGYKFAEPESLTTKVRDIRDDPKHFAYHVYNRITGQWLHAENFVQSEYAREFIRDALGVPQKAIHELSDYINLDYLKNTHGCTREDVVLYNPRKGYEVTSRMIEKYPDITWVALEGFTREEMAERMHTAKVYVDFGYHPGKDRIPREAAMCGCCVITNRRGSARNDVDVPIPPEFKFDEPYKMDEIRGCIMSCFDDFENQTHKFEPYRIWIADEKRRFDEEVLASAKIMTA